MTTEKQQEIKAHDVNEGMSPELLAKRADYWKARAERAERRAERWHTFATHRQTHITQLKAEIESLCRHVCIASCPECAAIREAKKATKGDALAALDAKGGEA